MAAGEVEEGVDEGAVGVGAVVGEGGGDGGEFGGAGENLMMPAMPHAGMG
jgi:hypothetical protein